MAYKSNRNDFWITSQDLAVLLKMTVSELVVDLEHKFGSLPSKQWISPKYARRMLSSKGFSFPERVVSFQMLKGGVAKTTSALNFGLRAAQYGARVLFVDLDQQANLSFALGVEAEDKPVWIDIVEKRKTVSEVIVALDDGVDLIPSSLNNSVLDRALIAGHRNWAQAIRAPLKEIRAHYDLVVIDTAPNLSVTNTAVTSASDWVVLPINPDKFSLLGLKKNLEDLEDLRREFGLTFTVKVLFTKFDSRETSSHEFLSLCMDNYDQLLLKNYIRTSAEFRNSLNSGRGLYSLKSKAKDDYDAVTREILGWE